MSTPEPRSLAEANRRLAISLREAVGDRPVYADARLPRATYQAAMTGRAINWEAYQHILAVSGASGMARAQVRDAWEDKHALLHGAGQAGLQRLAKRHVLAAAEGDEAVQGVAIAARNPVEFNALLRAFVQDAGLKPNQVVERLKKTEGAPPISRSQVYALLAPGRDFLPTRAEQVLAILKVCGASVEQIQRVMAVWKGLRAQSAPIPVPAEDTPGETESTAGSTVATKPANTQEGIESTEGTFEEAVKEMAKEAGRAAAKEAARDLRPVGRGAPRRDDEVFAATATLVSLLVMAAVNIRPDLPIARVVCNAAGSLLIVVSANDTRSLVRRTCGPFVRRHWTRLRTATGI